MFIALFAFLLFVFLCCHCVRVHGPCIGRRINATTRGPGFSWMSARRRHGRGNELNANQRHYAYPCHQWHYCRQRLLPVISTLGTYCKSSGSCGGAKHSLKLKRLTLEYGVPPMRSARIARSNKFVFLFSRFGKWLT